MVLHGSFYCGLLLWALSFFSLAATSQVVDSRASADRRPDSLQVSPRATSNASPVALRILPLGASIMRGYLSTDGNGMRWAFRSALVEAGHSVNMIGSLKAGTMGDNDNEAWIGYRINQVAAKAERSIPKKPNVAVILCGSNDIVQNYETSNMTERMAALIDRLFTAVPGIVVIVSTLPPNANASRDAVGVAFNANLTALVHTYQSAGKLARIVDAHSPWFSTADLQRDGLHFTNAGYLKLARVFYDGVIATIGDITTPINTGISDASPPDPANSKAPSLPVIP